MEALQFAYWLQGFAELNGGPPSAEQWQLIREHLQTVFKKVTPSIGPGVLVKDGPNHEIQPIVGVPYWGPGNTGPKQPLTAIC